MAQSSGFDPTLKVKTCFDCKMFDVAHLNGEDGPGGMPSHEALSVSPQGALEISLVVGHPPSVVIDHFSLPRVVAKSHKRDEGCRSSSQRPQYPNLYRRLKQRLGHSLRASLYKGSVVRQKKGPESKPVLVFTENSTVVAYINKRNPLGGDVRCPVEDHDLVPSLPDNPKSQTHSRVSECDGLPPVQVKPSPVKGMVTASTGVRTDLAKVVHSSCSSICHWFEPQSSTICISSPGPKC